MRSLSQIKERLINILQGSPTWRRLLRGLVGQELVSWGSAVAYLDDVSYDSLTRDVHPSSASDLGLSLLSASYGVPFQNFKPGFIVYLYKGLDAVKPYGIKFEFNGHTWYNIESVLPGGVEGQVVKLYQGRPVGVVSQDTDFQHTFPNVSEVFEVNPLDVFLNPDKSFFYVRLRGSYIVPSSIRVQVLTPFMGSFKARLLTSEEVSSSTYFSVYSLPDGGQAVRFHDAIPDFYQVTYLEADMVSSDSVEGGGVISVTDPSTSNESKRSSFIKSVVKNSALSTKYQVESFCRASGVLDAKVVRGSTSSDVSSIAVFFIPDKEDPDLIKFYKNSLEEALTLYGSMSSRFIVSEGHKLSFQVLYSYGSSTFDKASFTQMVEDFFTSESPVSFSMVLSDSLLAYAHSNGFSGVYLSYLFSFSFSESYYLSSLNALFTSYSFYKNGVLDRWSFGSDILGLSDESVVFSEQDRFFVMTDAVLVQVYDDKSFYIFNKDTGVGHTLKLTGYLFKEAGGDVIFLEESSSDKLFILRLKASDQVYACSTGNTPRLIETDIVLPDEPSILGSRGHYPLSYFDKGYFSLFRGLDSQLYQMFESSVVHVGAAPGLLFYFKGYFYFRSSSTATLIRRTSLQSEGVEVSFFVDDASFLSAEELLAYCWFRFSGDVMTATRIVFPRPPSSPTIRSFMFKLTFDAYSLVATSFPPPINEGFTRSLRNTTVPAMWDDSPKWYSFEEEAWVDFHPVLFTKEKGSVLADGSVTFTDPSYVYDYVTVEASSARPFSSFNDASYFKLNPDTPVVKK